MHGASSYLQTEREGVSGCGQSGSRPPAPTPTESPPAPSPLSPWLPLSFPTQPPSLPLPGQLSLENLEAPNSDPQPHNGQSAGPPFFSRSQDPICRGSREQQPLPTGPSPPCLPEAHSHSLSSPSCLEKLQHQWPPPRGPALPEGGCSGCLDLRHVGTVGASFWVGLVWVTGAELSGTDGHWARDHSTPRLGNGRQGGAAQGLLRGERTGQDACPSLILDQCPHVGAVTASHFFLERAYPLISTVSGH